MSLRSDLGRHEARSGSNLSFLQGRFRTKALGLEKKSGNRAANPTFGGSACRLESKLEKSPEGEGFEDPIGIFLA